MPRQSNQLVGMVAKLVESFPDGAVENKRLLVELLDSDPEAFTEAALDVLKELGMCPGTRFVTNLLAAENLLITGLLDPAAANRVEAIALTKAISDGGTSLQPALERALGSALLEPTRAGGAKRILRLLDLFAAVSGPEPLDPVPDKLNDVSRPQRAIQSRVADWKRRKKRHLGQETSGRQGCPRSGQRSSIVVGIGRSRLSIAAGGGMRIDQLPDALENAHAQLVNQFTIHYRVPAGSEPGPVLLKVSCSSGAGDAGVTFESGVVR